jgi:SAM-dependent methyltransferase
MAGRAPLLDVRPGPAFLAGHAPGAAGIPLEELARRVHELPPPPEALRVADADPARAADAADFLSARGHLVEIIPWDSATATEAGASRARLWRPNPFLIEALAHIRATGARPGRALDVACGTGRDAAYLALEGYAVEALDVLPDAIERAQDLARRSGVRVTGVVRDLELDPSLPAGCYDLLTVFRYLQRDLFPALRAAVAPGGFVVYETFHERNRATGRRPQNPDHLLRSGELAAAFDGFEVVAARDGFERDGRFFSNLLARRPFPAVPRAAP